MKTIAEEPIHPTETAIARFHGLNKREYFAALAMQSLCSRVELSTEERARYAVENADDLLAELERSA